MLNEIMVIGIAIIISMFFITFLNKKQKPRCVILQNLGAHDIDRADLINMLEDAQETFIKLFKRSSPDEWGQMRPFLVNTCRDLNQFIDMHQLPSYILENGNEWANKNAFVPEIKEIDSSLFCILRNLQIIKLIAKDTPLEHLNHVLDMRWFDIVRDIHMETGEISRIPENREILVMKPDYIEPHRKRTVNGRPQGAADMEFSAMDRSADGSDDLISIERESIIPNSAIPNTRVPTFNFVKFGGSGDDRWEKQMEVRGTKWTPQENIMEENLDLVRDRMRGKKDILRKKSLANDYDFLDDPEFNYG